MFVLFLIIAIGVTLISWTTAPSRRKSSADEYFSKGDISKADELLRKVWTRRDDIPAHLAWMYFELIKKGNLKYVQTVLSIQTNDLSEVAKKNLTSVQNDVKHYIEDKASCAFYTYDYTEAIKYNETLIPFGKKYKNKDDEYRVYRELKNYLSSGRKGSALNIYISNNQVLVIKCIKNRVKELDNPLDVLKLLSLMLGDEEIKTKFEVSLLSYVLHFKELPELKGDVDKYQRSFLEDKADSIAGSQILDAICIYTAIYKKKPNAAVAEKIELLNYRLASDYIQKGDYNHFKQLHAALKLNSDISANLRYDLDCKYNSHLFQFLSDKLREKALKGEKWDAYLNCCAEYAAHTRTDELFNVAQELYTQERSNESLKLCRLLNNSEQRVFDLVLSNVINLLNKSTKYSSLSEVYDKAEVLPQLAEKCFEYASTLGNQGDFAKAVYIERLTEPYFEQDCCNKYDVLITHYSSYAMSFSENKLPEQLDIVFEYLRKVEDKTIVEKHYKALEGFTASFLSAGKATKAYEVSKRIYDTSKEASRLFLDSALALAQKKKLKDSYGLAVAIAMQDDVLAETLKFIPYFPGELRHPYVVGYARKVVELYKEDQQSAIDFYSQQSNIDLREEILIEISKSDSWVLKTLVIDTLNNKENKLPKATHYADTVVEYLINNVTADEKRLLLKDLVLDGYNYQEHYIRTVLEVLTDINSLEDKLEAVNDALSAVGDQRLYEIKHEIAVSYIDADPQKSLSICSEIESKVDTKGCQLKCHIKLAEDLNSLDEKYDHLKCAKKICSKRDKENNEKINSLAFSIATSYYIAGAIENAYSIYEAFNIIEVITADLAQVSDINSIADSHIGLIGLAKVILPKGKAKEAYEISKRLYTISQEASRVFLDSALELAKNGKLSNSFGLSAAITMQDDVLAETLKFIPYFPDELRHPYIVGYARKVIELYRDDSESAILFFNNQDDLTLKGDILGEIAKESFEVFHEIIIDIFGDKHNKLPIGTRYTDITIRLISEKIGRSEGIILLKDLVISGYNAKENYIQAIVSSMEGITSLEERLDAVNDALSVVDDNRLYQLKYDTAVSYIDADPQKSLSICSEIEQHIDTKVCQFNCYIKLTENAASLTDKHEYLSLAKKFCKKSNKKGYAQVITLALSLASSYFVSGKSELAYVVYEEFHSIETEIAFLEHKLKDTEIVGGDAAASKEIKSLIDRCDSSVYAAALQSSEIYSKLWQEYVNRNLSKAEKQRADKVVESLIVITNEVESVWGNSHWLYRQLTEKISHSAYEQGLEYEENGEYNNAIQYYDISIKYGFSRQEAIGRRVLSILKQGKASISSLKKEVDKALTSVPRNIEKDIVYRFVLRLLSEGYVTEAKKLAEERLRDNKLLDLCESYKLRKVQTEIDQFNEQLIPIRNKKATYDEARKLYDIIEDKLHPIVDVFPEYSHLITEYKTKVFTYMLKMAQKEEKYDILYSYYHKGSADFIKDTTRFRNLAAACIGMIEQGALNDSNYKEIIAIWLTAVYNDYLIVRSLDQTKWDDGYTFTLDDSLSQTYDYVNLPRNINYQSPDESNISIGHVQKSLLERSDAALSNGDKKYYDFYLQQRKAMDAYSAVKYKHLKPEDHTENIIAPYALAEILPPTYMAKMKASLNSGEKEHGYQVGYLYGFTDDVFTDYAKAMKYYYACIASAKKLSQSAIDSSFTKIKMNAVRRFRSLYSKLIAELTSLLDCHINDGGTYKTLLSQYGTICEYIGDESLSYKYTEFINSQIIPLVNNKSMSTEEGLKILYEAYQISEENFRLGENISGMLINVITEYIMGSSASGWDIISKILNDTNEFNSDILELLASEQFQMVFAHIGNELRLKTILDLIRIRDASAASQISSINSSIARTKIYSEINDIVDKVQNDSMTGLSALQRSYEIYKNYKSDSRVCENLAGICIRCIMEYIRGGKVGYVTVKRTLDDLYLNRSTMFLSKKTLFKEVIEKIKENMDLKTQMVLGLSGDLSADHLLNEEGKRSKEAISYLKKFAQ